MFHDPDFCTFCGRFVLPVDGWAEFVQPYRNILASWDDEVTFFDGAYHFSCLRSFEHRSEFRREMLGWIGENDHLITVLGGDGNLHEMRRIGLGYTRRLVGALDGGEIFESPRFNQWVYSEYAGPSHFLDLKDVTALAQGLPIRGSDGGGNWRLPKIPGPDFATWNLDQLLDFLDIRDLYQDMPEPEYEFWDGGPKGTGYILTYGLSCVRPIPSDVAEFFAEYMAIYVPKRPEDA